MKNKVLIPTDGSDHANDAVKYVIAASHKRNPIRVVLLNVQPEIEDWQTHGLGHKITLKHLRTRAHDATAVARASLDRARIPYKFSIGFGDPAEVIVRTAKNAHCDSIVLGTRGVGRFVDATLGSVAYKVVHLAQIPVTLVK